jgi:hypothetical protein
MHTVQQTSISFWLCIWNTAASLSFWENAASLQHLSLYCASSITLPSQGFLWQGNHDSSWRCLLSSEYHAWLIPVMLSIVGFLKQFRLDRSLPGCGRKRALVKEADRQP